jgi:hypothetical protein
MSQEAALKKLFLHEVRTDRKRRAGFRQVQHMSLVSTGMPIVIRRLHESL